MEFKAIARYVEHAAPDTDFPCRCHHPPRPSVAVLLLEPADPTKTPWDLSVSICLETAEAILEREHECVCSGPRFTFHHCGRKGLRA